MRPLLFLAAILMGYPASASPPGERAQPSVTVQGPYGTNGAAWLLFPSGDRVPCLPAVVFTQHRPSVSAPIAGAVPLGPGGFSWRIAAPDVPAALALAASLQARPEFAGVSPDLLLARRPASFDDPYLGGQWYLEVLGMERLWEVELGSPDIRVAVIDSAIAIAHPDLVGATLAPWDTFADDDDPSPVPGEFCANGAQDV